MRSVFRRLSEAGFPEKFVKEVALPDWWDDEAGASPSGLAHGLMLISRHLGVELTSLQQESSPVRLCLSAPCKFKKRPDAEEDDLAVARALAVRIAQLAVAATEQGSRPRLLSAKEVRQLLLDEGNPWIGFSALVDYCWSVGLPVIHLSRFPKGARRPDGMAALVHGRPVILICCQRKSPAWMLFLLAHELGHISLGHVADNGLLIDEKLSENGDDTDAEEMAANAFAVELLTGKPNCAYRANGRWPNAQKLAMLAKDVGRREHIDPGHIVLNYAHNMGVEFFPVANAALSLIEPRADALPLLRDRMAARLDWSALPADSSVFLMRVTQAKDPEDEQAVEKAPA
jgi:hypothetical protein